MSSASTVAAGIIAGLSLLLTGLSLNVSRLRLRHRISHGDGGHKELLIAMRAHGNALEQCMLFAVLLLASASLPAAGAGLMMWCAGAFTAARVAHAAAMFGRWLTLRQLAHAMSLGAQLALAASILLQVVRT